MKSGNKKLPLLILAVCIPFMLACAYLESLIQVPEPKMEENVDTMLAVLRTEDWVPLQALAPEAYAEEDYAKPGTLNFTATVTNEKPVYFNYGWCTADKETLQQNFEHIAVHIYLNDGELGNDVVHNLSYTLTDGKTCLDFGILFSDWPAGEYTLKVVATFTEPINDGFDDYEAGDYVYVYDVTVAEEVESASP